MAAPTLKVVVNSANLSPELVARLEEHAEIVVTGNEPDELRAVLADADAAILNKFAKVTAEVLSTADRLKAIATVSAGTEHVDRDTVAARGIRIISGAGVNAGVVSEYVLGGMVAAHRDFLPWHTALTSGTLTWSEKNTRVGTPLEGTTLGLFGFGRVGQAVAQRAIAAFGCEVLIYDPYHTGELPAGVQRIDEFSELFERSLTVSLHAALTPETRGVIGSTELKAIGPDGVLIQAARGPIVVEEALCAALEAGDIRAAVIDVFDAEPPAPELIARLGATGRVLMTPHMASITRGMIGLQMTNAVEGIIAALIPN